MEIYDELDKLETEASHYLSMLDDAKRQIDIIETSIRNLRIDPVFKQIRRKGEIPNIIIKRENTTPSIINNVIKEDNLSYGDLIIQDINLNFEVFLICEDSYLKLKNIKNSDFVITVNTNLDPDFFNVHIYRDIRILPKYSYKDLQDLRLIEQFEEIKEHDGFSYSYVYHAMINGRSCVLYNEEEFKEKDIFIAIFFEQIEGDTLNIYAQFDF